MPPPTGVEPWMEESVPSSPPLATLDQRQGGRPEEHGLGGGEAGGEAGGSGGHLGIISWEGDDGGDARLATLVPLLHRNNPSNWSLIASHLPGRTGRECRTRWRELEKAAERVCAAKAAAAKAAAAEAAAARAAAAAAKAAAAKAAAAKAAATKAAAARAARAATAGAAGAVLEAWASQISSQPDLLAGRGLEDGQPYWYQMRRGQQGFKVHGESCTQWLVQGQGAGGGREEGQITAGADGCAMAAPQWLRHNGVGPDADVQWLMAPGRPEWIDRVLSRVHRRVAEDSRAAEALVERERGREVRDILKEMVRQVERTAQAEANEAVRARAARLREEAVHERDIKREVHSVLGG